MAQAVGHRIRLRPAEWDAGCAGPPAKRWRSETECGTGGPGVNRTATCMDCYHAKRVSTNGLYPVQRVDIGPLTIVSYGVYPSTCPCSAAPESAQRMPAMPPPVPPIPVANYSSSFMHLRPCSVIRCLDLSDTNLHDLPGVIFHAVPALESLIISHNYIRTLPPEIGLAKNLQKLWAHGNCLQSLPEAIGGATNLRVLHLSDNSLSCLPESLGRLRLLHTLQVQRNHLRTLPASLGFCTELTILNAGTNKLLDLPTSLVLLRKVEKLLLENNRLTILRLGYWPELTELDASRNFIEELQWPTASGNERSAPIAMEKCRLIRLGHNQIRYVHSGTFGRMRELKQLILHGNRLHDIPSEILQLPALQKLHLGDNFIRNLKQTSEGRIFMPQLECLALYGNRVNHKSLSVVTKDSFPKLQKISLHRNNLPAESWTCILRIMVEMGSTLKDVTLSGNASLRPFLPTGRTLKPFDWMMANAAISLDSRWHANGYLNVSLMNSVSRPDDSSVRSSRTATTRLHMSSNYGVRNAERFSW